MATKKKITKKHDPDLVPLTEAMEPKGKKTPRAGAKAKAGEPKKLSALDAAAQVLKGNKGEPMNCGAMVEAMREKKLWTTDAPTPHATLHSALMREINVKKADSRFAKVDRGHFALKE